jgi:uncharacterized membrane protein YedE/YeeE
MQAFFRDQAAWYVAGPLLGLCVVALYATINQRLGVLGGFSEVVERLSERSIRIGWKASFLVGIVGGGALYSLASGGGRVGDGYGWLTRTFSGATTVALLFGAGALIGYGAKTASGCTSGHGLSGNAILSRASLVATATFFATAVAASFATKWIFGAGL